MKNALCNIILLSFFGWGIKNPNSSVLSRNTTAIFHVHTHILFYTTKSCIMTRSVSDHSKNSKEVNDESESFVRPIAIHRKKGQTFATAFARAQLQLRRYQLPVIVISFFLIIFLIGK